MSRNTKSCRLLADSLRFRVIPCTLCNGIQNLAVSVQFRADSVSRMQKLTRNPETPAIFVSFRHFPCPFLYSLSTSEVTIWISAHIRVFELFAALFCFTTLELEVPRQRNFRKKKNTKEKQQKNFQKRLQNLLNSCIIYRKIDEIPSFFFESRTFLQVFLQKFFCNSGFFVSFYSLHC